MTAAARSIPAGEFKAKCLQLMDWVDAEHISLTITKHGVPVARLVPVEPVKKRSRFGCMTGTIRLHGDITAPIVEKWEAEE